MEVKNIAENYYYVTDENLKVGLGREESPKNQLGIIFEIFNSQDADMAKGDWDYEIGIMASIILHSENPLDIIFQENYRGGVDCNEVFSIAEIKKYVATMSPVDSFEHDETQVLPIIFDDSMRGISLPLMFDDEDIILPFLNKVAKESISKFLFTIGFKLDQCVNGIGNTGWDMLEMQRGGKDLISEKIKTLVNR